MLYDMLNGNFPVEGLEPNNGILPFIKPEHIELFIELSQLGNSFNNVYVHYLNEQKVVCMNLMHLFCTSNSIFLDNTILSKFARIPIKYKI